MSLFQLYETERKPFKVGKKWICVDPNLLGFDTSMQDKIVEIIDLHYAFYGSPVPSVRIIILTGEYYKGAKYRYRLDTFKQCFKPITTEIMSNA